MTRKGVSPVDELRTLFSLARLYRRLRPSLVHHVTIKPMLYGSLAARLAGRRRTAVVNAISGLGFAFSSRRRAAVLRPLVKALYRLALRGPRGYVIFQNPDDLDRFVRMGLAREDRAVLVRGSGVDCSRFRATPEPAGDHPLVVLPSRLLWDKGVGVFAAAARAVRATDPAARFTLVGAPDRGNPTAVPVEKLESWAAEGIVEWWGHREDMPEVLSGASIVVLPTTYPEGVPKALLEAAASGRAIVATDVPGCREVVRHGVNGLLVPPGDAEALTGAVRTLLRSPGLRESFGRAGRGIAVNEFAEEIVAGQTMDLYRKLLGAEWPRGAGTSA